jgi:hypothetical protein
LPDNVAVVKNVQEQRLGIFADDPVVVISVSITEVEVAISGINF